MQPFHEEPATKTPLLRGFPIAGAGFERLSPTLAYRFVEVIELG
jgi:hypothetical protein